MLAKRFPQFAAMAGNGPTWQQQVLAQRLGLRRVHSHQRAGRQRRRTHQGHHRPRQQGPAAQARRLGRSARHGAGARAAASTTSKPTRPSMRSRWASKAIRATARRRWWPWPTTRASPSPTSVRPAKAEPSSTGTSSASRWATLPATSEYHWMAGNFLKYAGPLTPGDLPVDEHELIALCAPRPVFISGGASANGDALGRPQGHVPRLRSAPDPSTGCSAKRIWARRPSRPWRPRSIDGDIAFRQHTGGHTPGPNWPTFLTFASRYLHAPGDSAASGSADGAPGSLDCRAGSRTHARLARTEGLRHAAAVPRAMQRLPTPPTTTKPKANVYPNIPDPLAA